MIAYLILTLPLLFIACLFAADARRQRKASRSWRSYSRYLRRQP